MNLDEYVAAKVDSVARWTNDGLRDAVILMVKEAMRDQRHACAEAVQAIRPNAWSKHAAHQAVMNAEPKQES